MNTHKTAEDLLRKHGFHKTPIRMEMLQHFMQHGYALSAIDIESKMKGNQDRVIIIPSMGYAKDVKQSKLGIVEESFCMPIDKKL